MDGYVGDGHFACVGVWSANSGGCGDRWVFHQRVFDDAGVDVVPAANDEVLGSPGQIDEAIVIDAAEVSGVEPSAVESAQAVQDEPRLGSTGDVAGKDVGSADE